jgi:hypothetical protein
VKEEKLMKSLSRWSAAVALMSLCVPASAQIISTSVPKEMSGKTEKKWSFHVMASPFAKWQINDYIVLDPSDCRALGARSGETCAGIVKLDKTSKMLLAGEVAFHATSSISLAAGGWYNKIGTAKPEVTFLSESGALSSPIVVEANQGSISEFHGGVFYKDFGLQYGVIKVGHELLGGNSRTDGDGYLVYKPSFGKVGLSVGLGSYNSGSFTDVDFGEIPSVSHAAGFVTASVRLVKGLSVDGSFWYINKSKGAKDLGVTDSMTRYMVGIGYSL